MALLGVQPQFAAMLPRLEAQVRELLRPDVGKTSGGLKRARMFDGAALIEFVSHVLHAPPASQGKYGWFYEFFLVRRSGLRRCHGPKASL